MKLSLLPARVSTRLRGGIFCSLIAAVLGGFGCGEASRRDAPATTPPPAGAAASANKVGNPSSSVTVPPPAVVAPPVVVPVATNQLMITGRVRLRGTPPPETELQIDPDCARVRGGRPVTTHSYVVGADSGLAEVFVHLSTGLAARRYPPPVEPVVIKTIGCEFQPCVTAAQTGQRILFPNGDAMLHNIQADPTTPGRPSINKAQIPNGPVSTFVFDYPELFLRFKTDVHYWMKAYVCVVEHPFFAVTDTNGVFHLPLPPPGRYEIEAVHRRAGKSVQTIEVEADKELAVRFTLEVAR